MTTGSETAVPSRAAVRTGFALSGLAALFLAFDSVAKLLKLDLVVESTLQLGYPEATIQPIGLLLLLCLVIYLIPRTAILGAVLLTGYMGGAIATHVRIGSPLLTHVLFPVYLAAFYWGGLWLRDRRVRMLWG